MMEVFRRIAASIGNPYIEKFKADGGRVIGFPCTFLPEEIISAGGMLPFRLRATGITTLEIGDTYYGPVVCSFPKCLLQLAGEKAYSFLDGMVITPGCDTMRRLDECWRKAGDDIPGIVPGYFGYFGVPHKSVPYSRKWFADEMRRFIKTLEDHFGISITDENLGKVILTYNETRKMFKKMDEIRASSAAISGEDALAVAVAASAMPRDEFNAMLATMIEGLEKTNGGRDGRKRLLLVGSINDDLDFVRVIEECGAVIAGDSLCFGARSYESMVDEEGDPVEALSRRYLDTNLCPRMFGAYRDRLAFIKKQVARTRANGVILQNIRFCDIHGSENGIFARDLEAEGIPCVRMEREYGPLVESGRVKMRVEAFLERL